MKYRTSAIAPVGDRIILLRICRHFLPISDFRIFNTEAKNLSSFCNNRILALRLWKSRRDNQLSKLRLSHAIAAAAEGENSHWIRWIGQTPSSHGIDLPMRERQTPNHDMKTAKSGCCPSPPFASDQVPSSWHFGSAKTAQGHGSGGLLDVVSPPKMYYFDSKSFSSFLKWWSRDWKMTSPRHAPNTERMNITGRRRELRMPDIRSG